jgi:p-aminobenzoyl-glutamate transporter AbgT
LRGFDSNQERAAPSGIYRQSGAFIVRRTPMMDVVMLAIGLVFFTVSIAYVYACDRL